MAELSWRDLRDWLSIVDELGELRHVEGASWQEDVGAVTELLDHSPESPAALFDAIPGYPRGYRVLTNASGNRRRMAVTLGLDPTTVTHQSLMAWWRKTMRDFQPLPPVEIPGRPDLRGGPARRRGRPVQVPHPTLAPRGWRALHRHRFPEHHARPGQRRGQPGHVPQHDPGPQPPRRLDLPGKHGRIIRDRYLARGEKVPICVSVGHDPLIFLATCIEGLPPDLCEYDWAGGVVGEPVKVVRAPITGLPIPAYAEIVLEGYIDPEDMRVEGPYGEFMGYYASGAPTLPTIEVQAVYHRKDPIILGCPQGKPPHEDNQFLAYARSCLVWDQLERAGLPDVTGVWCPPLAANRYMTVVSIKQRYPGHARQAGVLAAQVGAVAYMSRYIIVVDDDVDVTDMDEVLFAVLTRSDPERSIEILKRCWSGPLDPAIPPKDRGYNSRAIIDACRPWEWRDEFPPLIVTPERAEATRRKWGHVLAPTRDAVRAAEPTRA